MSSFDLFGVCAVVLLLVNPIDNAPKHKYKENSSTKFDQKQTGDYNVQLHLKDFHIFALLSDDAWGNLGDYDYNYDYSELTIKPSVPSSSSEASSSTEASSSSEVSSTSEVTTFKAPETTTLAASSTSEQPILSSTVKVEKTTTKSIPVTSVSLIPVKIVNDSSINHPIPLGEILHYRRCADGYAKDAQGRCRKSTRKNYRLPFSFTRVASKLASKIRRTGASGSSR